MSGDPDDLLGDGRKLEVEARFRELEREAELERLRGGPAPRPAPQEQHAAQQATAKGPAAADPLADIKAQIDGEGPAASTPTDTAELLYVIVLCPNCQQHNRTSIARLRRALPRCGACRLPLARTRASTASDG